MHLKFSGKFKFGPTHGIQNTRTIMQQTVRNASFKIIHSKVYALIVRWRGSVTLHSHKIIM